jgi:hypothetical protein
MAAENLGMVEVPKLREVYKWLVSKRKGKGVRPTPASTASISRELIPPGERMSDYEEQMTRHDAQLADDLKAAQDEMVRNNLNTAEQLRDQIASIGEQLKARQEQ